MIELTRWRKGEKAPERLEFLTFKEAKAAAWGFKRVSLRCDSCEASVINGHFCHETGCPEAWRDHEIECCDCGCDFQRISRQQIRCNECAEAFYAEYHNEPV